MSRASPGSPSRAAWRVAQSENAMLCSYVDIVVSAAAAPRDPCCGCEMAPFHCPSGNLADDFCRSQRSVWNRPEATTITVAWTAGCTRGVDSSSRRCLPRTSRRQLGLFEILQDGVDATIMQERISDRCSWLEHRQAGFRGMHRPKTLPLCSTTVSPSVLRATLLATD